jgi:hypothetical protein
MKTFILRILAILIGAFAIVAGEADDSPGLQGIGLIIVLYSLFRIASAIKDRKK